ncbi:MAG: peptidylprolyl isomerase [Acidobacteriota bacterium]|jgi:peptidyl-prolyl cis-trans isomerase B (cyclophilin B)
MIRPRLYFVSLLSLGFLAACASPTSSEKPADQSAAESAAETAEAQPKGQPYAVIITDQGDITVELLPELAPETVRSFIELAGLGFYNRTAFHRIMKDRMIQGGDPLSRDRDPFNDGQGTSGSYLPQEFTSTPVDRGTVAMGHGAGVDNGGSCQFFIVLKRTPEWDGKYNVFGKVVDGLEVADKISNAPLTKDPHPALKYHPAGKQTIESIRIEYRP